MQAEKAGREYRFTVKDWCRYHPATEGAWGTQRLQNALAGSWLDMTEADKAELARERSFFRNREFGRQLNANERSGRKRAIQSGCPWEVLDYIALYKENSACCLCGEHVRPYDLTFEHLVPIARGGGHVGGNVYPAHFGCNARKSDMTPAEYRDFLTKAKHIDTLDDLKLEDWANPAPLVPGRANRTLQILKGGVPIENGWDPERVPVPDRIG